MKTYKLRYDTSLYPFREIVKETLKTNTLENLHEVEEYKTLTREKDQSTTWHKLYYSNFDERFRQTYYNFIDEEHDSRVSVDFRIAKPSEFVPSTKGSINTNISFDVGGYFEKI